MSSMISEAMSNLVPLDPKEIEIADTVNEALSCVQREDLRSQMVNVFFYLAELGELGSIQNLISEANRGSLSRLQEMLQSVREEMRSLRRDMINGFERLHAYHEWQHAQTRAQLAELREKVYELRDREPVVIEPVVIEVHEYYDCSDNSYHDYSDRSTRTTTTTHNGGGEAGLLAHYFMAAAGYILAASAIAVVASLLIQAISPDNPNPQNQYQVPSLDQGG